MSSYVCRWYTLFYVNAWYCWINVSTRKVMVYSLTLAWNPRWHRKIYWESMGAISAFCRLWFHHYQLNSIHHPISSYAYFVHCNDFVTSYLTCPITYLRILPILKWYACFIASVCLSWMSSGILFCINYLIPHRPLFYIVLPPLWPPIIHESVRCKTMVLGRPYSWRLGPCPGPALWISIILWRFVTPYSMLDSINLTLTLPFTFHYACAFYRFHI